jgi:hypothetical protein
MRKKESACGFWTRYDEPNFAHAAIIPLLLEIYYSSLGDYFNGSEIIDQGSQRYVLTPQRFYFSQ